MARRKEGAHIDDAFAAIQRERQDGDNPSIIGFDATPAERQRISEALYPGQGRQSGKIKRRIKTV